MFKLIPWMANQGVEYFEPELVPVPEPEPEPKKWLGYVESEEEFEAEDTEGYEDGAIVTVDIPEEEEEEEEEPEEDGEVEALPTRAVGS